MDFVQNDEYFFEKYNDKSWNDLFDFDSSSFKLLTYWLFGLRLF